MVLSTTLRVKKLQFVSKCDMIHRLALKDGYLDFSHLTELKKIYITEIYMKKTIQIIKN